MLDVNGTIGDCCEMQLLRGLHVRDGWCRDVVSDVARRRSRLKAVVVVSGWELRLRFTPCNGNLLFHLVSYTMSCPLAQQQGSLRLGRPQSVLPTPILPAHIAAARQGVSYSARCPAAAPAPRQPVQQRQVSCAVAVAPELELEKGGPGSTYGNGAVAKVHFLSRHVCCPQSCGLGVRVELEWPHIALAGTVVLRPARYLQ